MHYSGSCPERPTSPWWGWLVGIAPWSQPYTAFCPQSSWQGVAVKADEDCLTFMEGSHTSCWPWDPPNPFAFTPEWQRLLDNCCASRTVGNGVQEYAGGLADSSGQDLVQGGAIEPVCKLETKGFFHLSLPYAEELQGLAFFHRSVLPERPSTCSFHDSRGRHRLQTDRTNWLCPSTYRMHTFMFPWHGLYGNAPNSWPSASVHMFSVWLG